MSVVEAASRGTASGDSVACFNEANSGANSWEKASVPPSVARTHGLSAGSFWSAGGRT